MRTIYLSLLALLAITVSGCKKSEQSTDDKEITIAVASNFASAAKVLVEAFKADHDINVTVSLGSSGKHFSQISNGAPYDIFLSADSQRPLKLQQSGLTKSAPKTYAIGQLCLWSPDPKLVDPQGYILKSPNSFKHLAIANPKLAPYGKASSETLKHLELYQSLRSKIVTGENINQTYQFITSGNAELGFIAYSQVLNSANHKTSGSHWLAPQTHHPPIAQQAVLLSNSPSAEIFYQFLFSPQAQEIIKMSGYLVP
ncbi:molybdate ABC transporter substrate-binding protein [Persicirhabdus sediminis]|uniref:Molybdate ABC transporter substrate-binding protein n=1 Tax=Persicirhabdus sediminis TaxID=454144 RepID=A0A8J7MFF6_9BACT|nr:molybdate ABC transporter substrate-binding protein [Persicirhabdus sediminis]MBK1792456.1 molybdate ABC transporter substrate-binding protein [Persicirhabdus sediminis]